MSLITCIILQYSSMILFITGICFIIYEDITLSSYSIFLAIILAFGNAYCGHVYFNNNSCFVRIVNISIIHMRNLTIALNHNTKLRNKCDSCNKYLPDSATDTCPYCGETINTKVGEIPESKKSSDEKQKYSKCPNCEKSLKDMKDIDNCPYCGFHLTHISTNKLTECQYCHRSLDGMEHIGDKCPYCGNKIEN